MKIKYCQSLLLLILLISTANASPITGLNAVPSTSDIYLYWDDTGATNYTTALENYSIVYTDSAIDITDGVLDDEFIESSYKYLLRTPNPVTSNQYDEAYVLIDDDYEYFGTLCHDDSTSAVNDYLMVYIDVQNDGLDTLDRAYQIRENGGISRYRWTGSSWGIYPGSSASGTTSGAGTQTIQMEFRVPLTEISGEDFEYGMYHRTLFERRNWDVQTFFPCAELHTVDTDDSSTWNRLEYMLEGNESITIQSVTTSTSNTFDGLCPYTWYRAWVYPDGNVDDAAKVGVITLDLPRYNVTGCVYDYDTGAPLFNALVLIENGFAFESVYTNISGCYKLVNVYNGTYIVLAEKEGYANASGFVTVAGDDAVGDELYLRYDPAADVTESATTDTNTVYLLTVVALVFLFLSVWCMCAHGIDLASVFCMLVPTIISYKISNLWIDGTLTDTQKFISSTDTIIIKTEVIRNTAMSNLYEFIAIGLFIIVMYQIYIIIKSMKVERDF